MPSLLPTKLTELTNKKGRGEGERWGRQVGDDLLSHAVARILPSALAGLTSGFGMGPGVPPPLLSPTNPAFPSPRSHLAMGRCLFWPVPKTDPRQTWRWPYRLIRLKPNRIRKLTIHKVKWRRLSPRALVRVRLAHCCPYTSRLSSWSSTSALTRLPCEGIYLEDGFPLRCFQRLSSPDLATQRCRWHDNWHTSGPSTPVLSY